MISVLNWWITTFLNVDYLLKTGSLYVIVEDLYEGKSKTSTSSSNNGNTQSAYLEHNTDGGETSISSEEKDFTA